MTVLQELIEIIKDKRKESDISNTLLRFCQVEAEMLLEKEKKQIANAWVSAWMDSMINPLDKSKYYDLGEEYYTENYENTQK